MTSTLLKDLEGFLADHVDDDSDVAIDLLRKAFTVIKDDHAAMQRIMQVLGPNGIPKGVDYGLPSNLAGLDYEVSETLAILRTRGIEYKSRSVERREALQKGPPG